MNLSNKRPAALAVILIALASCKPDETIVPVDNTPESIVTPIQLPMVDNVYGAMYSIKLKQVFNGKEEKSELASAEFYDSPSNTGSLNNKASAGIVSVNNISLNQNLQNNEYARQATEGHAIDNLNFETGVTWVVYGDDGIPAQTFSWSPKFPRYFGSFPSVINRVKGISFTFDDHTQEFADSIFVAISAGDKLIVKRYSGHAGTVTIPAAELLLLQPCTATRPGYLQISSAVPDVFMLAQRPTAIIKQTTEIRTVIIN